LSSWGLLASEEGLQFIEIVKSAGVVYMYRYLVKEEVSTEEYCHADEETQPVPVAALSKG
jgi:hypothetical protein